MEENKMSKDRNARVNQCQMKKLLDLLSAEGKLVGGRVLYNNTNKRTFWKRIALQLNNVDNGAVKNFYKWCKMWADWKTKTKKKADIVLRKTFTNQKPNFTKLELRLLKLISYPVDDLLCVLSEAKTYNVTQEESGNLNEDSDPIENNFDNDNSTGIDKEGNREFIYIGVQETKDKDTSHSYDIFDSEKIDTEIGGVHIKVEELPEKQPSHNDLEYFKAKARYALEKERIHQKSEELKLKALELKLKADELKLKETEVSKVNYLTQLEDQKLKCMTDIAASLKQLVEWTRNGGTRFHNVM